MANAEPVVLHSLLGMHPNTRALKTGEVSSPLVTFDFFEVKVANTQFKALVRESKYDFGELAMVTFLQAKHYGKPYVLLPATISGAQSMTVTVQVPLGLMLGVVGVRLVLGSAPVTVTFWPVTRP